MSAPSSILSYLGRVVHLMANEPDDRDRQREAFVALKDHLSGESLVVTADLHGLTVDGHPLPQGMPHAAELWQQMRAHGVGEFAIPEDLKPAQLLFLVRALALPAGACASARDFTARLDERGRRIIRVRGPRDLPPADQLIQLADVTSSTDDPQEHLEFYGVDRMIGGMPSGSPPATETVQSSPGAGRDALREGQAAVDRAASRSDWTTVVDILRELIQQEEALADPVQQRRFRSVIRGLIPRRTVEHIARLSGAGTRVKVATILQWVGAEATAVLLDLLAAAPTIVERREFYTLLTQMRDGTAAIVNRLVDPEWFVVRNVAELCGELELAAAVPRLSAQVTHADPRVRRAVVAALGKIATTGAAEALRTALRDPEPTVRLEAAQHLDARVRGLAMTLAVLLDEEKHPDVRRELHHALGRMGSPEAVQALARSAEPGRGFFGRKPAAVRLEAIEGLRLAGGEDAAAALRRLTHDTDQAVATAAQAALTMLNVGKR